MDTHGKHKVYTMLKKLVKYGNSNALILDKTILSLLELEEGSLVKMKIHGNVLTITPANDVTHIDKVRTETSSYLDTFPAEKKDLYESFMQKAISEKWDSTAHPEQYEEQKSAFSDYFQEQQMNIKALSKDFSKYPQIEKIQDNLMKKYVETTICMEEYSALFMEEVKKIDRNLYEKLKKTQASISSV